jgi:hypothetical protein
MTKAKPWVRIKYGLKKKHTVKLKSAMVETRVSQRLVAIRVDKDSPPA